MLNILKKSLCLMALVFLMACSAESSASRVSGGDEKSEDTASNGEYGFTPSDFYRQCTDEVCQFKMYEGVRRETGVATWHPADTGFSLIGDPVVVSVADDFAAHPEVPVACYSVAVLGYWKDDVKLFLEITGEYGIFGMTYEEEHADTPVVSQSEGEFKWRKRLGANDWQPLTFTVRSPKYRGRMNFSFRKEGSGDAVFYLMEVNGQPECPADAIVVD